MEQEMVQAILTVCGCRVNHAKELDPKEFALLYAIARSDANSFALRKKKF
jgi:hypothetical protein